MCRSCTYAVDGSRKAVVMFCIDKEYEDMTYRVSVFFFFQAEDGIRDVAVTGVQTCALPISFAVDRWLCRAVPPCPGSFCATLRFLLVQLLCLALNENPFFGAAAQGFPVFAQIGRASCRERV